MEEIEGLEQEINLQKLDDFKVPDSETDPIKRKRMIRYLIILISLIVLIAIIVVIIVVVLKNNSEPDKQKDEEDIHIDKIKCKYFTQFENETIDIINKNRINDVDFDLIINEKNIKKNYKYLFENPGEQNVTFIFKNQLKSLNNLFYNINKMI